MIWLRDPDVMLYHGDAVATLHELPDRSVHAVVTSPPYGDARAEYPAFDSWDVLWRELSRVVAGPALFNVGRRWAKGIEQLWWLEIVNAARYEGWSLVDTLVWTKPNANPIRGEVFTDSHEYVLAFCRPGDRFNEDEIRTPYTDEGKARMARKWVNGRGVKGDGPVTHHGRRELHPAGARARSYVEFPVGEEKSNPHPAPMAWRLARHLVLLGLRSDETVLDPFAGSGTTLLVARKLGRRAIGIELNKAYCEMATNRLAQQSLFVSPELEWNPTWEQLNAL